MIRRVALALKDEARSRTAEVVEELVARGMTIGRASTTGLISGRADDALFDDIRAMPEVDSLVHDGVLWVRLEFDRQNYR